MRYQSLALAFALTLATALPAQDIAPVKHEPNGPNSAKSQKAHYVVMVSLDGFRWDYAAKYNAIHLKQFAAEGATAPDGMIPAYPTVTFPNHYTLVTGLYPEHHGIVGGRFYEPAWGYEQYVSNGPQTRDGKWYGGTPLWSLAEKQHMRSAVLFWPGSEAEIAGARPSYWVPFDDKFDDSKRIDQVMAWLMLPPTERPHFIALYYSNVDHASHDHGVDSPETAAAVKHVDELMGELAERLKATKLSIDLVIVSDHGHHDFAERKWVEIDKMADLSMVRTSFETKMYCEAEAACERAYNNLKALHDDRFEVYRQKDVPEQLHYQGNARIGDPVIIWKQPYAFRVKVDPESTKNLLAPSAISDHGWDVATVPEMKASFYAVGPDIKRGVKLPSFENVDVYDFVSGLLGLNPAKNDGNPKSLKQARR